MFKQLYALVITGELIQCSMQLEEEAHLIVLVQ